MFGRRNRDDDEDETPRAGRSSWSTRAAWLTLAGGAAVLLARVSLATVVQVHGSGMAPSLREGDYILLLRQTRALERGDVVVYDPLDALGPGDAPWLPRLSPDHPTAPNDKGHEQPDVRKSPQADFRNTAVVDREELERNWAKVRRKSDGIATRDADRVPMRIGRILAIPGDRVSFNVKDAVLGLAVDDEPLIAKPAANSCEQPPCPTWAFEQAPDRRYRVFASQAGTSSWPGLHLPSDRVTTAAEGYLVVADNRDEGACCDSRTLGWIPISAIRGKVMMRLGAQVGDDADL